MKTASRLSHLFLVILIMAAPLCAQDKVAEGEYQVSQSAAVSPQKHWVLTTRPAGGYLLRSEIETPADGIRVVQVEELNDQLIPANIGYDLYLNKRADPAVTIRCSFASRVVTCDGKSEKGIAPPSKPYPYKGPFLFAVQELSRFDFAWLMAGALNMAHLTSGKARIRTIRVAGGAALELTDDINVAALQSVMTSKQELKIIRPENYTPWEFISDDDDVETLAFVGVEEVPLNETRVPARHYSLQSSGEALHFWVAAPGIVLKITGGDEMEYVLANYRQYKKLIPEIKLADPNQN